jgi:hypothetical protein
LSALVGGAIAQMKDVGLPVTADSVLARLGNRWLLSRRRLRDVFAEVSRSSTS